MVAWGKKEVCSFVKMTWLNQMSSTFLPSSNKASGVYLLIHPLFISYAQTPTFIGDLTALAEVVSENS